MMKLNCELSVWQKSKDFSSQMLSFLWIVQKKKKRLQGQTIDNTVTIPNLIEPNREKSEKSVTWNRAL